MGDFFLDVGLMKIGAYRRSLERLASQALADYDLHVLLTPTDSNSPYYGLNMVAFADMINNRIDEPQVLKAASIEGPPIPEFVDLDSLPGSNSYTGNPEASKMPEDTIKTTQMRLRSAVKTLRQEKGDISRKELMRLLQSALHVIN